MLPILDLGPLSLPIPPLVLLLGFWLASTLAEKQASKSGADPEIISKITWVAVAAGLLGARLSFIARNMYAFRGQWASVLSLNPALLDISGGLVIAAAASFYVASKNQRGDWSLLDQFVPFIALFMPAIYIANFASGAGYGTMTDLPWRIEIWGAQRHPVQLYYLLSSLVVFTILEIRKDTDPNPPGSRMLSFIIYTAGYITIFSRFQDPGGNLVGSFRTLQLTAWAVFTIAMLIAYQQQHREDKNASS